MNGVIGFFQVIAETSNLRVLSERNADDYVGENGLLYCGKCHTPRQCKTVLNGQTFVCGCICECRAAKKKYEDARYKISRAIAENKKSSEIPMIFQTANLADMDDFMHRKFAHNYAEKFEQIGKRGLLLYGDVGTGKSFMAACIANLLLEKGYSVKWTTTLEFVDKGCFFSENEYADFIDSIAKPDLLIVDDLGAERNTEFAAERVQEMIDRRSGSNKPMIITTNLDVDGMAREQNIAKKRTYDRVLENCYPILFRGKSYRMKQAKENFSDFGNLLNE